MKSSVRTLVTVNVCKASSGGKNLQNESCKRSIGAFCTRLSPIPDASNPEDPLKQAMFDMNVLGSGSLISGVRVTHLGIFMVAYASLPAACGGCGRAELYPMWDGGRSRKFIRGLRYFRLN